MAEEGDDDAWEQRSGSIAEADRDIGAAHFHRIGGVVDNHPACRAGGKQEVVVLEVANSLDIQTGSIEVAVYEPARPSPESWVFLVDGILFVE